MVIGLLSFWFYEEYLNNPFLRVYVDNIFQTTGWVFAVLATIVILGIVATAISRGKHAKNAELETVEPASIEPVSIRVENPTPTATERRTVPGPALNPIVAELKAELASRLAAGENVLVPTASTGEPEISSPQVAPQPTRAALSPIRAPALQVPPVTTPPPVPPVTTPQAPQSTPATVITGMVPVQKKEKQASAEEKPQSGEGTSATA